MTLRVISNWTRRLTTVALASTLSVAALAGTWTDDFSSDNLNDYEVFNLDRQVEQWDVSSGTAVGEIFAPGFYSLLLLKPRNQVAEDWSDYTVKVRTQLSDTKANDDKPRFGLSLYDQEYQQNRYLFLLALDTDEIQVIRVTNGVWQIIPFAFPVEEGVWYELEASVSTAEDSESVTFSVDGVPVNVVATSPLKKGLVGMVVSDAEAAFDDLEISGGNVPNGGRATPRAVTPQDSA
ncbi:MAG: hypothetical protein O3A46_14200, partial [Candidatus Poribacteria bacterium]|nr:hypothetical protein [Candidatus Poribacteria bacterium]